MQNFWASIFDIDYADGFARPNTRISVFDENGNLILHGARSNIADDLPAPLHGLDTDDLSRGSGGQLDPYIGTQQLPTGTYYVAISSDAQVPTEFEQFFVADAANPYAPQQIEAVEQTLQQIGAAGRPTLLLFNKIDAVRDESLLTVLRQRHPDALEISARRGTGLERLRARVAGIVRGQRRPMRLSLPVVSSGRALSFLRRYADIRSQVCDDGRIVMDVAISPRALAELRKLTDDLRVEDPAVADGGP